MTSSIFANEKQKRLLSDFEFLHNPSDKNSKLGVGSFASVKLAKEKKTGKQHAIKIISMHPDKISHSDLHNIKTEISIHRKLDHPNIIKFHDYIHHDNNVYLILDYAESGNLYSYIHKRKSLPPDEIFRFFYQATSAIQYLHQNDILHRDIKPENLLLDKHKNIKLCDFGWSTRRINEKRLTFCGTYEYMAPEIVHKKPYDYRVDIWSLGVLLYELIHREAPYKGRSLSEISKSLAKGHITFGPNAHPEAKDLILKILKTNPNERLSMNQIMSHPWVQLHLKPVEDEPLKVEDLKVSPREVVKQENVKGVFSESPRILPKRERTNFKSEVFMSCDNNDIHVESLVGSQTRMNSNAHVLSSFNGSSTLKEGDRERLKARERLKMKEGNNGSENHGNSSGNQRRTPTYELSQNHPLRSVDENIVSARSHIKSSSTLSNNILEKLSFEDKLIANSISRRRRIFENNVLSPNFKTKVDNIIHQLSSHTTTHKNLEQTSMFSSRAASRPHLHQPSQNTLAENVSIYRHYNEPSQPNQSQQAQILSRVKVSSRLDDNITPTASAFASPFASTYRIRADIENMRDGGYPQQTTKNSYQKKFSFSKGEGQSSLYAPASTTNRNSRSKIGSRDYEITDQEKNFSHTQKYSHADVTKSLNFKSFANILSVTDQNKYKIADVQEAGSSYSKYSKGLDYKRKQGYRGSEDLTPTNLHISSLSEQRNENKENKKNYLKDKESHMRIREDLHGRVAF